MPHPRISIRTILVFLSIFLTVPFAPSVVGQNFTVVAIGSTTTFTWNNGPQGWEGTNDFRLDSTFMKLGGPVEGNAWVTECPLLPGSYTEGAYAKSQGYTKNYPGPNLLISPWFGLSLLGDTFAISFQQSIAVEAGWDAGWMEYSIDGSLWRHLGVLNDPKGTNWYSTSLYENAESGTGDPPDTMTLRLPQYRLYGAQGSNPRLPIAWWTSNGSPSMESNPNSKEWGVPTGPFGWMKCRLLVTRTDYPDLFSAKAVRFRYVAFSDAANGAGAMAPGVTGVDPIDTWRRGPKKNPFQGWAIDNFTIESVR